MAKFNVTCGCPNKAEVWTEEQLQTSKPFCEDCKKPYKAAIDLKPPTSK